MISINLIFCKENAFILMSTWRIAKSLSSVEKEGFYRNVNTEDITDADYMHAKRLLKTLK